MAVDLRGVTTVVLAGTGSDDDYVYRAFSVALHEAGAVVVVPAPRPDRLVDGYRRELDNAARRGPVAVGGVSIGAAVTDVLGVGAPVACRRRAGGTSRMDRLTRQRTGRAGGPVFSSRRCASRWAGIGDRRGCVPPSGPGWPTN